MALANQIPRLERSVLSDQISQIIIDGLLEGQFKPGDTLVESELANMLGVSRSPIREAIQDLQKAGLVMKKPGRRAVVRRWTAKDLEELFSVRALLEGYAARLAAAHSSESSRETLEQIVADMRAAAAAEDLALLVQLDLQFHQELWRLSGNDMLRSVLSGLKQQFRLFHTMNWKFHGGANQVADNHQLLIDAINSGDPQKAEELMGTHVVVGRMVNEHKERSERQELLEDRGA